MATDEEREREWRDEATREALGLDEDPWEPFDQKDAGKPCVLCRCANVGRLHGFPVCDYHRDLGEDDPPCPDCAPKIPACPGCGERRWQVDCMVETRAAVMVQEKPEVLVDRAQPESQLTMRGEATCQACGLVGTGGDASAQALAQALVVARRTDVPWRVIEDYRDI